MDKEEYIKKLERENEELKRSTNIRIETDKSNQKHYELEKDLYAFKLNENKKLLKLVVSIMLGFLAFSIVITLLILKFVN